MGTSQTVDIPAITSGIAFLGFTDAGASISSITIHASGSGGPDFLGIDDVRFVATASSAPVPEPAMFAIWSLGAGAAACLAVVRRRKL